MTYILKSYDEALEEILKNGVRKSNRTGVDAVTIFGMQKRYDISTHFPLLTKRKVWPRSVFAELIWMLSGSTNNEDLKKLGCNFWTPWVDEEFEKKHGYVSGAFGPVYGFQLRRFGGYYPHKVWYWKLLDWILLKPLWQGKGFDQIQYMMDLLSNQPDSRRNQFSMWNPQELHRQRLPPCHFTFQLFVNGKELSGCLTQRSCDFGAGVPANLQFYSALIYMFAQQGGYKPRTLIHNTNDSHIYTNQLKAVERYLGRSARKSPTLELNKAKDIFSYQPDDFIIRDYYPHGPIKMPVEV